MLELLPGEFSKHWRTLLFTTRECNFFKMNKEAEETPDSRSREWITKLHTEQEGPRVQLNRDLHQRRKKDKNNKMQNIKKHRQGASGKPRDFRGHRWAPPAAASVGASSRECM